jgi:hypothetical protein
METRSLKRKRESEFPFGNCLLINRDVLNTVIPYLNLREVCCLWRLSKGWKKRISEENLQIDLRYARVLFVDVNAFGCWTTNPSRLHCSNYGYVFLSIYYDAVITDAARGISLSFINHPVIRNHLTELYVLSCGDFSPIFDLLASPQFVIPTKLIGVGADVYGYSNLKMVSSFIQKFKDKEVYLGECDTGGEISSRVELMKEVNAHANGKAFVMCKTTEFASFELTLSAVSLQ